MREINIIESPSLRHTIKKFNLTYWDISKGTITILEFYQKHFGGYPFFYNGQSKWGSNILNLNSSLRFNNDAYEVKLNLNFDSQKFGEICHFCFLNIRHSWYCEESDKFLFENQKDAMFFRLTFG